MSQKSVCFRFPLWASFIAATFLVTGCGGGGDGGDGGSGPAASAAKSSFTAGPITSAGSGTVTVKGTQFEVRGANVADDDDRPHGEQDLKLGMRCEIEAGQITTDTTGAHAQATNIRFRSGIIGPVDAIDTATRLLVVLGQTIDVSDTTVFDDRFANGAFGIRVGDLLEIHGTPDLTTGHFQATRIEAAGNPPLYKITGVVTNLNTTTKTFMIGGQTISYANLSPADFPNGLANGMLVTIRLQKAKVNGVWVAARINDAEHRARPGQGEFELKGRVTSVTSATQFNVEGLPVDASNARFDPSGATIFLGADVEVEGTVNNGTLVAREVEFEDEHGNRRGGDDDRRAEGKGRGGNSGPG